jgi:hypothetical protein
MRVEGYRWGDCVSCRLAGYVFQMEVIVRARQLGFTVGEVRLSQGR